MTAHTSRHPIGHRLIAGSARLAGRAPDFAGDRSGNVMIEFGLLIIFIVTLAIGAFDFGRMGYMKIAVSNAARAGTQYGAQDSVTAGDAPGMVQAARNDIGDNTNALLITAGDYYECPGQGVVAFNVICNDGSFPLRYVQVTVPDQLDLLFPYPGITSPRQIASTNIMRVR